MKQRPSPLRVALFSVTAAAVAAVDLVSKAVVFHRFPLPGQGAQVLRGFFCLTHVQNRGGVFGALQGEVWFFILFSALAIGFVLWLFVTQGGTDRILTFALGLVMGGAVGNLYDRLMLGHVRDFLDFRFGKWAYPTFNIADSAICVGVGLLALASLRTPAPGKEGE